MLLLSFILFHSFRSVKPSAAKFVRLAFHDCLKYDDGTGGCDGCLNWEGMGVVYRTKKLPINGPVFEEYPDNALEFVGNNNLVQTVLALEHVFDDTKIFKKSKHSLRQLGKTYEFSCFSWYFSIIFDAGKSRADLWALAGIAAVEFAVNQNNLACRSKTEKYAPKLRPASKSCGHMHQDETGCMVTMPNIPFKTGRKDCTPDSVNLNR